SADQNIDYSIWQVLLREILYRPDTYANLQPDTISEAKSILEGNSPNLVEDLKAIIIKLISAGRFVLLVDNFNFFSNFDVEIFLQLIPVLQVSKIKIVLTEDSSYEYNSNAINNLQAINLNPLTEIQVTEFISNSFADFYPKDEIKKAVILYSDVLPGSIEIFLKDLIVLDILKFTSDGPLFEINESLDKILKGSQEDIYRYRINSLDSESRDLAILLSLFNINLDINTVVKITGDFSRQKVTELLIKLSEANIIHFNPVLGIVQFTSQGMKEYICSTLENLKEAHLEVAELISKKIPNFNKNELARHWELAGKYEQTYATLREELTKARSASALAYERNLLEHLSGLPLSNNSLRDIKIALCHCLFQIGELKASIALIDKLLDNTRSDEEELLLKILNGKALIASQSVKEGQAILESVLNKIDRTEIKNEMLSEIAEAEYEMAKYENAEKLVDQLITDKSTSVETAGKVYRIKALLELFKNNNPEGTIKYLIKALYNFQNIKQMAKVASMHNNLGNIFNIVGERNLAEENWNRALNVNNSIGNLQQNAIILLNFGIYHLESCNYEKAVEYYLEALSFFKTLGDKNNLGITYINMGEAYLILCEYEKAIDVLKTAADIFNELDNNLEKGEAEFLLGRLFFQIGDDKSLNRITESYGKYKNLHLDKLDFNYKYLGVLHKILTNESSGILEELFSLREVSKVHSDSLIFCDIQIKIIEYLISFQNYQEALKELISEDFQNICSKNLYFNSYKDYLMGKVIEAEKNQAYKPFLSYYEDAFNQISSISITELTWKILYELSRIYKERGNISRSSEYGKYAKQTLLYIVEQIKSSRLKKLYLENPERKTVLNKLEDI
ncbi:MAG: tetratricopeptide repeat protein, partial [Ignavibacteriaceae bacterium]